MPRTREVVTIQIGSYSNFVGAHWWNMQESSFCFDPNTTLPLNINHDVLFREGQIYRNEVTFLPRLLCIDEKRNFRRVIEGESNTDLEKLRKDVLWNGEVDILNTDTLAGDYNINETGTENQSSDPTASSLEKDMKEIAVKPKCDSQENRNWNSVFNFELHPRSICYTENSHRIADPTDTNILNNIEDNLRLFVEECDFLQGFQILMDGNNEFYTVEDSVLHLLKDEYSKNSCICFPCYENSSIPVDVSKEKEKSIHSLYFTLMGFNSLANLSSLFNPLSVSSDITSFLGPYAKFPFLDYDLRSFNHTSAILATAVEALTSPYRLKQDSILMPDFIDTMTLYGRKMVASSMSFPCPLLQNATEIPQNLAPIPLTPFFRPNSSCSLAQCAVFRGFPRNTEKSSVGQHHQVQDVFGKYLSQFSQSSISMLKVIEEKCSISDRYPNIFSTDFVQTHSSLHKKEGCKLSVFAALANTDSVSILLEKTLNDVKNLIFGSGITPTAHLVDADDFRDVIANLTSMKEDYSAT